MLININGQLRMRTLICTGERMIAPQVHRNDRGCRYIRHKGIHAVSGVFLQTGIEDDECDRRRKGCQQLQFLYIPFLHPLLYGRRIFVPVPIVQITGMIDAGTFALYDERNAFIRGKQCMDEQVPFPAALMRSHGMHRCRALFHSDVMSQKEPAAGS